MGSEWRARGRTDAQWAHGGALGVDLVDVGETARERIGGDLVAVLVPKLGCF